MTHARLLVALLIAFTAFAQTPPRFEAASIRRNLDPVERLPGKTITSTRLVLKRATLDSLIRLAWDIRNKGVQLAESKLPGEFYDIEATTAQPATKDEMNLMLQTLLADRFKLVLHTEMREYQVLVLVAGKGGSKMTEITANNSPQIYFRPMVDRQFKLTGDHAPVSMLVSWLTSIANDGRPILDKTGLSGTYNFVLEFLPDQPAGSSDTAGGPSLFTALQNQLGLRLDPQKATLETLVIDHVEKTPTEN